MLQKIPDITQVHILDKYCFPRKFHYNENAENHKQRTFVQTALFCWILEL